MVKKQPKYIGLCSRPRIIVGEKMGRQRLGKDKYALEGNGSVLNVNAHVLKKLLFLKRPVL